MTPRLLEISEAAKKLGVPERALKAAAEQHGFIVRMGRAVRVVESDLGELIAKCRSQPKAQDYSCENEQAETPSGSSRIAARQSVARAYQIADKLKSCSPNTLRARTAKLVRLQQGK